MSYTPTLTLDINVTLVTTSNFEIIALVVLDGGLILLARFITVKGVTRYIK